MGANSDGALAWGQHIIKLSYHNVHIMSPDLSKHTIAMKEEILRAFKQPIEDPNAVQLYTCYAALALSKQLDALTTTDDEHFTTHLEACTIYMSVILNYMKLKDIQLVPKRLLLIPIKKFLGDSCSMPRKEFLEVGNLMKSVLEKVYPLNAVDHEQHWEEIGKHMIYGDASYDIEEDAKHVPVDKKELRKLNMSLMSPKFDFKLMDYKASLCCFYGIQRDKFGKDCNSCVHDATKKQLFQSHALSFMVRSNAASILATACLELPLLSEYVAKYKDALEKRNFTFTSTVNEANQTKNSFASLAEEITFVLNLLSTPDIFEPLSLEVIEKLSLLSMSCLVCALNTAQICSLSGITTVLPKSNSNSNVSGLNESTVSTPTREVDSLLEQHALCIVEKCIELFDCTYSILKSSYRIFPSAVENHFFLGAWVLFTGLHSCLNKEEKTKTATTPATTSSPNKLTRGLSQKLLLNFNNLFVSLCSHALNIFDVLVSDASFMYSSDKISTLDPVNVPFREDITLNILEASLNPINRIDVLLSQMPFMQFLLNLAFLSYKKSLLVKKLSKSTPSSVSKQAYFLEELSDESVIEEDEDSEPILGQWFEETIANLSEDTAKKSQDEKSAGPKERERDTSSSGCKKYFGTQILDKAEPVQYTLLATQIIKSLMKNFSPTLVPVLIQYEADYYSTQTVTLAAFINSLDRDLWTNEPEAKAKDSSPTNDDEKASVESLFSEDFYLSHTLKTYVDYLMTMRIIKGNQEAQFLAQLNVLPSDSGPWPLVNYRRALCILLQSLLLKDNDSKQVDILLILRRVISTLTNNALAKYTAPNAAVEIEDLNFEHALFLLYIFHLLDLMYRKAIFLELASSIVQVGQAMDFSVETVNESQLFSICRLLQLFDYMLKHLYDPPPRVLQLMNDFLLNHDILKTYQSSSPRHVSPCINEDLLKLSAEYSPDHFVQYGFKTAPKVESKFYVLAVDTTGPKETPKLDGLACSFLLGNSGKVAYKDIIDSLLFLTEVNELLNPIIRENETKRSSHTLAIEYCFSFAWKLLMALPPSVDHLTEVTRPHYKAVDNLSTLYYLIWGARAALPNYHRWLCELTRRVSEDAHKEMYAAILNQFAVQFNSAKFIFEVARTIVPEFTNFEADKTGNANCLNLILPANTFPPLNKIILLDGIFHRLQASMVFVQQTVDASKSSKTSSSSLSDSSGGSKFSTDSSSSIESFVSSPASQTSSSESLYARPLAKDNEENTEAGLLEKLIAQNGFLAVATSLFQRIFLLSSSTILHDIKENAPSQSTIPMTENDLLALRNIIPVATNRHTARYLNQLSPEFYTKLTEPVKKVLETWSGVEIFKPRESKSYSHVEQVFEDNIAAQIQLHVSQIPNLGAGYKIIPSLKYFLHTLITFIGEFALACPAENFTKTLKEDIISLFLPLSYDACSGQLEQVSKLYIERVATNVTKEGHQYHSHLIYAKHLYRLIVNRAYETKSNISAIIDEQIFLYSLDWFRSMVLVSEPSKLMALGRFFLTEQDNDILSIAFSINSPAFANKPTYIHRVILFLNQIFNLAEDIPNERTIYELCFSICHLTLDSDNCGPFLKQIMTNFPVKSKDSEETGKLAPLGAQTTPIITLGISSSNSATTVATNETEDKKNDNTENAVTPAVPSTSETSVNTHIVGDDSSENVKFLRNMVHYMIKYKLHDEALCLLENLIPLTQLTNKDPQTIQFPELISLLSKLADFVDGRGHQLLFEASVKWLESIKASLTADPGFKSIALGNDAELNSVILDNISYLLIYMSEFIVALFPKGMSKSLTEYVGESEAFPPPLDLDIEWNDDVTHEDDEDSGGDESDEDSLCNKLCTYTITQKEFMNQHWYHCHTCKMIDGVGVCSVCAQVCHKNHDITYSKFGNFFCDCGAKENGQCMALTKRNPQENSAAITSNSLSHQETSTIPSSLRQRSSFEPILNNPHYLCYDENYYGYNQIKIDNLREKLEPISPNILNKIWDILPHILEVFREMKPALKAGIAKTSPVGVFDRVSHVMFQLQNMQHKFVENTDNLMVPVMGSQEGAFENVRMNLNGDQGQIIRQLISNNSIRRTCMCILSSPQSKRQHLVAVSHEKGKITLLQLSGLLKQIDSSKRKLTLIKLASVSLPITILSVEANPSNEELLAVCGLKECIVFSFTSGMSQATDTITINPHCETSNYIIKALWIPGRQSTLAIVTALNIKIYQLDKDVTHPYLYFVLPNGKVRDATFVCEDNGACAILIMSSIGVIYTQNLHEVMPYSSENSAEQQFYVTQTMNTLLDDIADDLGAMNCGGVSIYFSHTLRLLFFSYSNGKSYLAPIPQGQPVETAVSQPTLLIIGSARLAGTPISKGNGQPLYQWMEVPNHPGLIFAMMQCNTPVALTIKPHIVKVQEIKLHPFGSKSKFLDMVAIKHNSRTTLILLCEDGSLRIYNDNPAETNFWLGPELKATSNHTIPKPLKRKKTTKSAKSTGTSPIFPVDFFEHCTLLSDVEFGGKDLLQLYNAAQVKTRFNTTGLYVVISKAVPPISIEIKNNDSSMVITGLRVLVGSHDPTKTPRFIEVFNRNITVSSQRNRWYNIPLTREESLQSDKSFTLKFGCSGDIHGIQVIDSITVYGKSKDQFGWPDEAEDVTSINTNAIVPTAANDSNSFLLKMNRVEKVMGNILHIIDVTLKLKSQLSPVDETPDSHMTQLMEQISKHASETMIMPVSASLVLRAKSLLSCVHTSRVAYYNFMDENMLVYAYDRLNAYNLDQSLDIDSEEFFRVLLMIRSIAIHRMHNLSLYGNCIPGDTIQRGTKVCVQQLLDAMWYFLKVRPKNPAISSVVVKDLTHVESVIHAMVDVLQQLLMSDNVDDVVSLVSTAYSNLLLTQDVQLSSTAKQAIIRVLRPRFKKRRVFIPTPPVTTQSVTPSVPVTQQPPPPPPEEEQGLAHYDIDAVEPIGLLNPSNVEALINAGNLPPLIDIPPDADDEAMVELAIALSLQEVQQELSQVNSAFLQDLRDDNQQRRSAVQAELQSMNESLQALSSQSLNRSGVSTLHNYSHYSDTTASPGGSDDDEGSTAATDGSTLRTSPAEQVGSAGSESGGSGADSITGEQNVSGRSSAYGDTPQEQQTAQTTKGETGTVGGPSASVTTLVATDTDPDNEPENETIVKKLHTWRIAILNKFLDLIPKLKDYSGVQVIPFLQVVLMLASDLDCEDAQDKAVLDEFITRCISEVSDMVLTQDLDMLSDIVTPSMKNERESLLVLLRFLSVLMMRSKNKSGNDTAMMTAAKLYKQGFLALSKHQLSDLLRYWREKESEEKDTPVKTVLKPRSMQPLPDFTPFFLKTYVKNHTNDIFESYPDLLTEILVRLTYQILKHTNAHNALDSSKNSWYYLLCEYMMIQHTQIRRQVRKLLLFICSTKEKYRRYRDFHALESHMKAIREIISRNHRGYEDTVELVEHLKGCADVSSNRVANWQRYCISDPTVLEFFFKYSIGLDEPIAHFILNLILAAILDEKDKDALTREKAAAAANNINIKDKEGIVQITVVSAAALPSTSAATTSTAKDGTESSTDPILSVDLVKQVHKVIGIEVLWAFIKTFLLESNNVSIRWQCHSLAIALYQNCDKMDQENMLDLLWSLWPSLHGYGRKAAQFTDILSFFTMQYIGDDNNDAERSLEFVTNAVESLRKTNKLLANHPNNYVYSQLSKFMELEGFYLETSPCPVCNNPEISFSNIKLSAVKIDSKFTTNTQIVKLVGSHTISKISLRIADLKRTKMVKTINIFYNNKSVQAVIELKNRTTNWNKAKRVTLESGQTEVKIEFPLPIVACNLMIEYHEFFENMQANSENLQCPRCSATVPANPGVCSNCGENAFQCHKCRAINYDEKDPFLCHACGFCKYAKFDYVITARPCCTVDAITNDEERAKAISTINSQLDKANLCYRQLTNLKPALVSLLTRIEDRVYTTPPEDINQINSVTASVVAAAAAAGNTQAHVINVTNVNKVIQVLAHRYSQDCKNAFEELSRTLQQVLASRKELLKYDKITVGKGSSSDVLDIFCNVPDLTGQCYACCFAVAEHCLSLVRALTNIKIARKYMRDLNLVDELMEHSLKHGTSDNQFDVKHIVCYLVCDDPVATLELCENITQQVLLTIKLRLNTPLRNELAVLCSLKDWNEQCSEIKVRCVLMLFFMLLNEEPESLIGMEHHLQNVLDIIHNLVYPDVNPNRSTHEVLGNKTSLKGILQVGASCEVDFARWLHNDPYYDYNTWVKRCPYKVVQPLPSTPTEIHVYYLSEKYWRLWRRKTAERKNPLCSQLGLRFPDPNWLKQLLFNPLSPQLRETACSLIKIFCMATDKKKEILDMLIGYLDELTNFGDAAIEYLVLMEYFVVSHWRIYMAVKGVLLKLADLFTFEVEILLGLEETTLYFDLAQGLVLHRLTEMVASFLEEESVKNKFKGRLVAAVLNGYLNLRRLVVQRTNHVDKAQEKLLELLEEMTSGTEEETKSFMSICIETVRNCSTNDIRTPVFVFERLCSIIHPEDSEVGEFLMTIEKDSQQEDFLQGRMLGNPYKSSEPGLGPLMRDIKNKICQDCELVALLDDDNGMELLVNNKIVSLDLPVAQVFRKVWAGDGGDGDVMRIIYRMRGLLGDATEEFIENLDPKNEEEVNNEQVYRMANVMAECGGIEIIVEQLSRISDLNRDRQLLQVILKLLRLCVKVKSNQAVLAKPELNAMGVLLGVLQLCLKVAGEYTVLTEQLLEIMESTISKVALETPDKFAEFSKTFGGLDHVDSLLQWITMVGIKPNIMKNLNRVIAALTYGNKEKMSLLTEYFIPDLDFEKFDQNHSSEESRLMNIFCSLTAGIDRTPLGNTLKDHIVSLGVVEKATQYILARAPMKSPCISFSQPDQDDWKDFITKPALKYVLYLLTGLSYDHEPTQTAVADRCIPVIHRLEQVSSDEHVGTMAENLLEALSTNPTVADQVQCVRERTKAKKKRLALAAREKQLGALGMKSNEKGQVVTAQASSLMQQLEDLGEETGLVCVICREGYKYQPGKVLGIYTFTKRCNVEEFESKTRKTVGYSTVTHFNVVHTDCHMAAVRLARTREEWESAALQNANTKCNGILPLWGPQVPESLFASSLARHNSYLQECTGHRDILYGPTIHDLKLLLLRFANEKSFHEDAGGGGPQSNMHLIPYLIHMALYVINTTRSFKREDQNLSTYLETNATDKLVDSCYEADGPHYYAVLSLAIHSHSKWRKHRSQHLRRLLLIAHVRNIHHSQPMSRTFSAEEKNVKAWKVYRSAAIFFALIDQIYSVAFGNVAEGLDDLWPTGLADYIRNNDEPLLKASEELMNVYSSKLLPLSSLETFCAFIDPEKKDIPDPDAFMTQLLRPL
uniref:E3 ubiquitin-protein ligase UBR4 n=1 Tax=Cacopsylla melanoneura TaxID=428564 RepID=A0A8D8THS7_9HEMI